MLQKRKRKQGKKQKTISVKEIRLSASIEKHDFQTKMKNAQKFIKDGDKVKISVVFRGREMMHTQKGSELLQQAISILDELVVVEQKPKLEGRNMVIVVAPK